MTAWTYCNAAEPMHVQTPPQPSKYTRSHSDWLLHQQRQPSASYRSRKSFVSTDGGCHGHTDPAPASAPKAIVHPPSFRNSAAARQVSICAGTGSTRSTIYIVSDEPNLCQYERNLSRKQLTSDDGDSLHKNVTVLRSVLYLMPNYEAQEISTLFTADDANADGFGDGLTNLKMYHKESTAAGGDYFHEDLCDDFDDTSSEDNDYPSPEKAHRSPPPSSRAMDKNSLPNVPSSQNIHEFMKKARKTVRKSLSSLNQQMRRSSMQVHNVITTARSQSQPQLPIQDQIQDKGSQGSQSDNHSNGALAKLKNATGSVRWTSIKTKLRPKYSTVSAANAPSIFYLNPEDLRFNVPTNKKNDDANAFERDGEKLTPRMRRRTTCLDFNATRPRPSSPPPPPPVCTGAAPANTPRQHADGNSHTDCDRNQDLKQQAAIQKRDSIATSDVSRSPLSSSNSDLNVSSCSDLRSRFADEPLYQFYTESVTQLTTNASMREHDSNNSDDDGYAEISSSTSRPSAMELITPCPNGHGQYRSLWCEVDEVKHSGILERLSISQQKLQEAKFEVITSEASYYKSLSVLDKLFANDTRLRDQNLLCKNDWKILFGNVAAVRKCSGMLLSDLEKCWQDDIMLAGLSDVIYEHASKNFKIFVKYCSNQIYIDRTLKKLRKDNVAFVELINRLEADPICQSLSLHSFLMLPMQRITRMPLLVDAIFSKLHPIHDQPDYKTFKTTLAKLNKIVKECNENARKFERYEEMLLLSQQLEFSRKDVKMFSVASSSRWLVKSGPLTYLNPPDAKLTITRKLTKNTIKFYFFLFNDILVIAKKKSEDSYAVVDYCLRNVMQMNLLDDSHSSSSSSQPSLVNLYLPHRYLLLLTILENHEGKMIEMVLSCDSDSTRQRWLEASYSRLTSDNPEEKLYEEWDCPQVLTVHDYTANQPDELSLQNGDVVKVLKKTTDGWYHGERIRDGIIGWFPGNYTVEVASQHTRAKNLKLRHRLLTLSADFLHNQQQK
ncbi:rho guanine nucleotide exchange factor 15-like isoform X2 [Planococcus citri]|uniref:rho guanine nucleotide exchange factor 15-like isoform X2 n=1 Tax=Planococcus citri TaxID=170843 RepID=UPI0031F7A773